MTIGQKTEGAPNGSSTRERITREAITILSEKGYAATSVREIAEASGVTKPAVYYYFDSKESLCHHIISSGLEEFRGRLRGVNANGAGDAFERLVMAVRTHFDFCEANVEFVRFIYALTFGPDRKKIEYDFLAYDKEINTLLMELVGRVSEAGLIRDGKEEVSVRYVRGIISAYVMDHVDGNGRLHPELAETIVSDMVNGLRP
jgi:AcrR family transcriptional regulator